MQSDTQPSLLTELDDDNAFANGNLPTLTQAWINERNAPEVLQYQKDIIDKLMERLEKQAALVQENLSTTVDSKFICMLYQTEMERVKYLIRSYLRTRLSKIERHTLHILRNDEYRDKLSHDELIYAEQYQELIENHYHKSFLHTLPQSQQKQDERVGGLNMVPSPDLEHAVFCRVNEDIGDFQLESDSTGEPLEMLKDNIYILRYSDVQLLLEKNRISLV